MPQRKGPRGKSLDEHLERGPNYRNSLPNVLMVWRFEKVAYTGDVRKMFNQVLIHPEDQGQTKVKSISGKDLTLETNQPQI